MHDTRRTQPLYPLALEELAKPIELRAAGHGPGRSVHEEADDMNSDDRSAPV
jgi:hypothetical protein